MVFAGDDVLVGKTDQKVPSMFSDLFAAIQPWKFHITATMD